MKIKTLLKTAAAAAPLIVGTAAPAYGCLVLPDSPGVGTSEDPGPAAVHSDQITCGPVGCGPNAPFEELQEADQRSQGQGFRCDPMCIAGNPDKAGGPR